MKIISWLFCDPYDDAIDWLKTALVIMVALFVLCLCMFIHHDNKYKCIRGHYQQELIMVGKVLVPENVWICDYEVLRSDTTKHSECDCK